MTTSNEDGVTRRLKIGASLKVQSFTFARRTVMTPAFMRTLQIIFIATVLIACAHALQCNVGATGSCPSQAMPAGFDLCWRCTINGGTMAGGCATSAGCLTGTRDDCVNVRKGTFFTCNTDNCNGCSPASSLSFSAFLLFVALVTMLLAAV